MVVPKTKEEAETELKKVWAPGYVVAGIVAAIERGGQFLNGHEYNALVDRAKRLGVDITEVLKVNNEMRFK